MNGRHKRHFRLLLAVVYIMGGRERMKQSTLAMIYFVEKDGARPVRHYLNELPSTRLSLAPPLLFNRCVAWGRFLPCSFFTYSM